MPSGGSPTIQQASTLTSGQKKFLNSLMKYATPQIGQGVEGYTGELTPGANELYTGEWNLEKQLLSGTAPGQAQANTALTGLMKPWDATEATSEWTKAIQDPAMLNWNKNVLPGLEEKFAGFNAMNGGMSSKGITDSAVDLQTGLASSLAQTLMSDKANTNQNILSAAGLNEQNLMDILSGASGGAAEQYNIGQAKDTAEYKDWLNTQPYNNPWVSLGLGGENVQAFENIVTPPTNMFSSFGSLLGGLGTGAAGLSMCCWIFMEANGGKIHPIVRRYRDEHMTERNRRGYYRMAEKLVPWMQKSRFAHKAVEWCMTKPMTCYGKYFYGLNRIGALFYPVAKFWLGVYNLLGFGKVIRSNGEVI